MDSGAALENPQRENRPYSKPELVQIADERDEPA
jgi:hypothetical protein